MPRGDRTGPIGQGPMTGRALGRCSGNETPGYTGGFGAGMGRGAGRGRGRGAGWFWGAFSSFFPWHHSYSKEDEVTMLKSQAEAHTRAQRDIEKRLSDLEGKD